MSSIPNCAKFIAAGYWVEQGQPRLPIIFQMDNHYLDPYVSALPGIVAKFNSGLLTVARRKPDCVS